MDSSQQIISDLRTKVGFEESLDFMHICKGVPVVFRGKINEVREESIIFQVEPPDSICLTWDEHTLILQDIFISGIQGRILNFDIVAGTVELGEFVYADRGYGERATVRVHPIEPIEALIIHQKASISAEVMDISLNGFGLKVEDTQKIEFKRGQQISLKLDLLNKEVEIPGSILGVFEKEGSTRLAISFSSTASGQAVVTRYITRRRAEIRQEIQQAYQEALAKST